MVPNDLFIASTFFWPFIFYQWHDKLAFLSFICVVTLQKYHKKTAFDDQHLFAWLTYGAVYLLCVCVWDHVLSCISRSQGCSPRFRSLQPWGSYPLWGSCSASSFSTLLDICTPSGASTGDDTPRGWEPPSATTVLLPVGSTRQPRSSHSAKHSHQSRYVWLRVTKYFKWQTSFIGQRIGVVPT